MAQSSSLKCSNLGEVFQPQTEVGTATSPTTARVVPTVPTCTGCFETPMRARARTHTGINIMSDRLEQLEQLNNDNGLECSNLPEGRHKTDEVGTAAQNPSLIWSANTRYSQIANTGHRVSAARGSAGWIYSAWGPDRVPGVRYHDVTEALGGREHYAIGQQVPQRFPWLGDFPTSADAKAACELDANNARTEATAA